MVFPFKYYFHCTVSIDKVAAISQQKAIENGIFSLCSSLIELPGSER